MRNSSERVTASWSGEELEVSFSASMEPMDYGVPGSPIWDEAREIAIVSLTILGVACDPKTLPDLVQDKILSLADEVEWLQ